MISSNLRAVAVGEGASVRCHRCGGSLAPGELSLQGLLSTPFGYKRLDELGLVFDRTRNETRTAWFHLRCAIDVHPEESSRVLAKVTAASPELDGARALADARRMGVEFVRRNPGQPFESEPARDPSGRPRVAVVAIGSAASVNCQEWMAFEVFTPDSAVLSPLREYVLRVMSAGVTDVTSSDPSMPVVACVLAALVDTRLVKAQREKLVALHEQSLSAPLLWIIGEADDAARNAKALELREAVSAAGFDGDECSVLCSSSVDRDSIAELGRALDELSGARAVPTSLEARFEKLLESLERATLDGDPAVLAQRAEAFAKWLSRHPSSGGRWQAFTLSDALRARARAVASAALSVAPARVHAMAVLWKFEDRRDVEPVEALVRALLEERTHSLPPLFLSAHGFVRAHDPQRAVALLVDGFFHGRSSRRRRGDLEALLLGAKPPSVPALLRAKCDVRPPGDAASREALALAEKIELLRR